MIEKATSINRIGETKLNIQGCLMRIIKYIKYSDIEVEFIDNFHAIRKTTYSNFVKGNILNPYYPTICGVGMIGQKYPASYIDKNGKTQHTKGYDTFKSMIIRCYNSIYHEKEPTYKTAYCCKEWHNRDNFEDWLRKQSNYLLFLREKFHLDKDILIKNNKLYSPETCCLVPQRINELFVKHKRKQNLPVGVHKNFNKYTAYCWDKNKNIYIGSFDTKEDAFYYGYKPYKERLIQRIAEEEYLMKRISNECYIAMKNYCVEIND